MDAITNLLTRNSPRELTAPIPSKDEMHEIYQAALRAPDHAWLRPSRFIEVTGKGLEKLNLNDHLIQSLNVMKLDLNIQSLKIY